MNQPYVKTYKTLESGEVIVANPIGEHSPYLHSTKSSRRLRRGSDVMGYSEVYKQFIVKPRDKKRAKRLKSQLIITKEDGLMSYKTIFHRN